MVAGSESLLDDLLVELTVGETYFYREPGQFEFLRREVLPGLRGSGEPVRAWSAGCASGEEAYTLAMLFADEGLGDRAHVLATDICREALARARRANYGALVAPGRVGHGRPASPDPRGRVAVHRGSFGPSARHLRAPEPRP